jgi:hypothetical protein
MIFFHNNKKLPFDGNDITSCSFNNRNNIDSDIKALESYPNLTSIDFGKNVLTDKQLIRLTQMTNLKHLSLSINDNQCKILSNSNIYSLRLQFNSHFKGEGLEYLDVKYLHLDSLSNFKSDNLKFLAGMSTLTKIFLQKMLFNDYDLLCLMTFAPNIVKLSLSHMKYVSGHSFEYICTDILKQLVIRNCTLITDSDLQKLPLGTLTSLHLSQKTLTDESLQYLSSSKLQDLTIHGGYYITRQGFKHISNMKHLKSLFLSSIYKLDDFKLLELKSTPILEKINITTNYIKMYVTMAGFNVLFDLPSFKRLIIAKRMMSENCANFYCRSNNCSYEDYGTYCYKIKKNTNSSNL